MMISARKGGGRRSHVRMDCCLLIDARLPSPITTTKQKIMHTDPLSVAAGLARTCVELRAYRPMPTQLAGGGKSAE